MIFSTTVRQNLDPFALYSDAQIWAALEKCQLKAVLEELSGLLGIPDMTGCGAQRGSRL